MPERDRGALRVLAGMLLLLGSGTIAEAAGTLAEYRLLVLGQSMVKWGAPRLGTGAIVSYAIVSRRSSFEDARNCSEIVPIDATLSASGIERSDFDVEVAEAFRAWSEVANIAFVRSDSASADILIGAEGKPRGWAFTNVAHRPVAGTEQTGTIVGSVICINPARSWKIGFDGNLDVYDLRYTLMHEIGHAIGLDHPGSPGLLMDFRYEERFSSLQPGDRAGAVDLYGPRAMADASPPPLSRPATGDRQGILRGDRAFGEETEN